MDSYEIVIRPLPAEEGGGYMGFVPDLHGCISDGETPEEAASNTIDAINEWIDLQERLGREIPRPGSARERARKERATLVETIHLLSTDLDQRVCDLEGRLEELLKTIADLQPTWMPAELEVAA